MRTIFKYQLSSFHKSIVVPTGSQFLCFKIQDNTPTVWYLVDTDNEPTQKEELYIFGTGQDIPKEFLLQYLGTVIDERESPQGSISYVWHLFRKQG